MCPDEEKGCSARDLVKVESCRGENLLSNDIKYIIYKDINAQKHIFIHIF